MALDAGVDLVLELPFAYACGSAERFAEGGVKMVQATGLDCHLVFGSESGNLTALDTIAEILAHEPAGYRVLLQERLDQGLSFPSARQQALAEWAGDAADASLLRSSNNILAVEYLKAIKRLPKSRLTPMTIRRIGQDYTERDLPAFDGAAGVGMDHGSQAERLVRAEQQPVLAPRRAFASATAIRRAIEKRMTAGAQPDLAGMLDDLVTLLPSYALAEVMACSQTGPGPVFPCHLSALILSHLRSRGDGELETIAGMGEGLARRLKAAASRPSGKPSETQAACSLETLLIDADTRRFTQTRIQRALMAMICGLTQSDLDNFDRAGGPQYLRVLGFDSRGRYLLKIMRKMAEKPIITKTSDFLEYNGSPVFERMASLDRIASDVWTVAAGGTCGIDFDTPVLMR
jgi:predicted nucleotidyltransferase